MSKKIWIPLLSVLLAITVLLSPISPVGEWSTPAGVIEPPESSIGELLDPSGNPWAHTFSDVKDIRAATFVVAASDSVHEYDGDYRCDGVNDHIEIQAALDALPATGGEVFLLDGTYNIEASLVLDSYQTLRGCGRNTILTTTTADVDIITATGTEEPEVILTGILIADLCIDGSAGGVVNDVGIGWTLVVNSKIRGVWVLNNGEYGIGFLDCLSNTIEGCIMGGNTLAGIGLNACEDNLISANKVGTTTGIGIGITEGSEHNTVIGNDCHENTSAGIYLDGSDYNNITGNTCQDNICAGISLETNACNHNTIAGNLCHTNDHGIYIGDSSSYNVISGNSCCWGSGNGIYIREGCDYNTLSGNNCRGNNGHGITVTGSHNNVSANTCTENSQSADNTNHNIRVNGDYNLVEANVCRQGALAKKPQYGIDISGGTKNIVQGNDLYSAGKTANFNDTGTCTIVQDDNREINQTQVKHMVYMKNTSGGNLVVGDVVSLNAIAAGTEFTTPAAVGEDQVWGMLAENIDDDAWGYVQVKGGTTLLKATNAVGGNIAIGDFLCTEAGGTRAQKAAAGDMAFAIALEVCEAADATIDALIVVPRKI